MTSAELENLVRLGRLKREPPVAEEIRGLLRSGEARLADAANRDLSLESRFDSDGYGYDRPQVETSPSGDVPAGLVRSGSPAYGLSIPCMASQLAKALNQPVLVVSLGYMPKP